MPLPFEWLRPELASLNEQGLVRERRTSKPLPEGWCEFGGRRLRNFASNDYLDLAHDPRVVAAAREALKDGGTGATASPLVTGRTVWHEALEARLAAFVKQPAAILFPTGYAANMGTIPALVGQEDAIFSDHLNHGSLVDGCRLSGAQVRLYRHQDLATLEPELAKSAAARRRLIISDSLFSMDGDIAPLAELCELAERYEAAVMIDEAHTVGVLGPCGRGVAELLELEERIDVRVGTLSKALGSLGGFVSGSRELIDWLWNRARPQMFSTALPPAVCAAAAKALEIVELEPWRREKLLLRAEELRVGLREVFGSPAAGSPVPAGAELLEVGSGPVRQGGSASRVSNGGFSTPAISNQLEHAYQSQIIVVVVHSPKGAIESAARLADRGYLVAAIRPPTVPKGTSRLRITLTAAHTSDDVGGLAEALGEVCKPL